MPDKVKEESFYLIALKRDVIDAYLYLRKHNQSIPSESLEFIRDTCLEKVKELASGNN